VFDKVLQINEQKVRQKSGKTTEKLDLEVAHKKARSGNIIVSF